jgi:hypothetical protein
MRFILVLISVFALVLVMTGCAQGQASCEAPKTWFPHEKTPEPDFHAPQSDCEFHQWAWQTLLWLTQPTGKNRIRLLDMPLAEEMFQPGKGPATLNAAARERMKAQPLILTPRVVKKNTPTGFGDIRQAGLRGILVDQKGWPVYYAVHVNPTFYQFVRTNRLFVKDTYIKAGPTFNFPVGSLVIKSSWRIVSPGEDTRGCYTTTAKLHPLVCRHGAQQCKGEDVRVDHSHTKTMKVALVGMHVVGVTEDHPEFVWATFEHQGNAPDLPEQLDPDSTEPVSGGGWTFYAAKTAAKNCNVMNAGTVTFDAKANRLSPSTNVYRQFPFGGGTAADQANIKALNQSVHAQLPCDSVWRAYFLLGSVWFARANNLDPGLEGPYIQRRVEGSVHLSNTTMETFNQLGRKNCFACHDTGSRGDIGLPAMNMNLVHSLTDALLQRDQLYRATTKLVRLKAEKPLKSYAAVRALLNDFIQSKEVAIESAPYGAFWNKMDYKEFIQGNIPGISDPSGKPLKVLVVGNARRSNLILALRGTSGTIFDPVHGTAGRLPPTGPFMSNEDVEKIAKWIDAGCPNGQ